MRKPSRLTISLHQPDDDDGLVRYEAKAENNSFTFAILFWGTAEQLMALASSLRSFPSDSQSGVEFVFGSRGTGVCTLNFICVDGWGHVALWVSGESEYALFSEQKHQRAELALRIEPAAIDSFSAELLALASGKSGAAVLQGAEP